MDSIEINLVSDYPLPDNVQEMIDDIGEFFYINVLLSNSQTESEAIEDFKKVFDYAEEKGYDLALVQQVLSQTMAAIPEE